MNKEWLANILQYIKTHINDKNKKKKNEVIFKILQSYRSKNKYSNTSVFSKGHIVIFHASTLYKLNSWYLRCIT